MPGARTGLGEAPRRRTGPARDAQSAGLANTTARPSAPAGTRVSTVACGPPTGTTSDGPTRRVDQTHPGRRHGLGRRGATAEGTRHRVCPSVEPRRVEAGGRVQGADDRAVGLGAHGDEPHAEVGEALRREADALSRSAPASADTTALTPGSRTGSDRSTSRSRAPGRRRRARSRPGWPRGATAAAGWPALHGPGRRPPRSASLVTDSTSDNPPAARQPAEPVTATQTATRAPRAPTRTSPIGPPQHRPEADRATSAALTSASSITCTPSPAHGVASAPSRRPTTTRERRTPGRARAGPAPPARPWPRPGAAVRGATRQPEHPGQCDDGPAHGQRERPPDRQRGRQLPQRRRPGRIRRADQAR